MLYKLIEGYEDLIRIMTVAPEIVGGLQVVEAASRTGIVVMMGHSDASFEEAENGLRAGARGITHIFNAMGPFHHRAPGLAGFGLLHPEAYIEVIGDPWHLHPATLRMVFRVKGPERIIIVSDTVKASGLERGAVKSGAGRLTGGSFTVTESVEYLENLGFSRDDLIRTVSENPARLLGLHGERCEKG
jgi:N-acetylglucosamine-6-phosphate deacetylase